MSLSIEARGDLPSADATIDSNCSRSRAISSQADLCLYQNDVHSFDWVLKQQAEEFAEERRVNFQVHLPRIAIINVN